MSGNYGWGGRDRANDFPTRAVRSDAGFSRAQGAYSDSNSFTPPSIPRGRSVTMTQTNRSGARHNVDLTANKKQKSTKENLLIIAMDTTGSMGSWRSEIFDRLVVLYKEAQGFLGESLEILFIGFGDRQECHDAFEVCPIGDGPILDEYIDALTKATAGGGNAVESPEMAALYVAMMLDTSENKSVHFFTVTDEGFYPQIDTVDAENMMGISIEAGASSNIYKSLKSRMGVYTILPKTNSYQKNTQRKIQRQWEDAVGSEFVIQLEDGRRVVDVILGAVAKINGQFDRFTKSLIKRQGGTQHGSENISTVQASLINVPGAPQPPSVKTGTKSLVDIPGVGTKSLLAD